MLPLLYLNVKVKLLATMNAKQHQGIKIGELASSLGVTTRTVRYYEEIGLMPLPSRKDSGVRVYGPDEVLRLKFILKLKEVGITLDEMRELASIYAELQSPEGILPRLVEMLDEHIQMIDEKMNRLGQLRGEIAQYRSRVLDALQHQGAKS